MQSRRRWDLWGAAAGIALGVADTLLLAFFGVDMTIGERNAGGAVALTFSSSFAFLGFSVGRLSMARAGARADAETIERQLRELEATQRRALENE